MIDDKLAEPTTHQYFRILTGTLVDSRRPSEAIMDTGGEHATSSCGCKFPHFQRWLLFKQLLSSQLLECHPCPHFQVVAVEQHAGAAGVTGDNCQQKMVCQTCPSLLVID